MMTVVVGWGVVQADLSTRTVNLPFYWTRSIFSVINGHSLMKSLQKSDFLRFYRIIVVNSENQISFSEVHEPTGAADSEKMKAQIEKWSKLDWSDALGVVRKNCEIPLFRFLSLSDCERNFHSRFFEGASSEKLSGGKWKSTFGDISQFFRTTLDDTKTGFETQRCHFHLYFSLSAAPDPWQL